jgi:flagellar biosynthesis/type III secretory pathway chaperone
MDRPADAALRRAIGMLEAILVRQTGIHEEMLIVAEAKQDAIIKGDLEKLEAAVVDERALVAKIEDEERKRLAVMPLVKTGVGAPAETEKLADVIALMPEPERTAMTAVREELKTVLEDCQIRTRHNAELLKASLEHVESFLRTLADETAKDKTYTRDGRKRGGGPGLIDRSI